MQKSRSIILDKNEEAVKVGGQDDKTGHITENTVDKTMNNSFVLQDFHEDKRHLKKPTTVVNLAPTIERSQEEEFEHPIIPSYFSKRQKVIQQSFSAQELHNRCQPKRNSASSSTACADITMVTQLS